jgi:excisionase family DNA binding protein
MSTEPNITLVVQETARLLDRIAVTVPEAAILCGMPRSRIRQAIYARELPVVQFAEGKAYYITVDDLRKWFERKKGTL